MIDQKNEFDLTRNDKFYELTIPNYYRIGDSVLYQIRLKDLVKNEVNIHSFRFKELKQYHEKLLEMKLELPEFPKTHLWKKTNKNPKMINQRKAVLQKFFNIIVNDPFTRGHKEVKKFIKICKLKSQPNRPLSLRKHTSVTNITRAKSLSKNNSEVEITFKGLKK